MLPYFEKRYFLSVQDSCVLLGSKVIIPVTLQDQVLKLLHAHHIGEVKMKALARNYLWFPNIDEKISFLCKTCESCQTLNQYATENRIPWPSAERPWQRIHLDFCHFEHVNILLITDVYSKWLEIVPVRDMLAGTLIRKLSKCFARWGIPDLCVLDNAPTHTSQEFTQWCEKINLNLQYSPPYSPKSNTYAERAIKTLKMYLKKELYQVRKLNKSLKLKQAITEFLFSYRNTPHKSTGKAPSELMIKRKPRTPISMLNPLLNHKVKLKTKFVTRFYDEGQKVYVKNSESVWEPGIVLYRKSEVVYKIKLKSGHKKSAHIDQLKPRVKQKVANCENVAIMSDVTNTHNSVPQKTESKLPEKRVSTRTKKPPERLDW
jgi:Integrase zinc binding domain/Integrase core domain